MLETENWVAIAFLCFLGLLAYLGAHRKMIDAIDRRQARIKSELEQARRLREEAQALRMSSPETPAVWKRPGR